MADENIRVLPAIPDFTKQDFIMQYAFDFLWQYKDDPGLMNSLEYLVREKATAVKYTGFTNSWKIYQKSKKTGKAIDTSGNDTAFPGQPVQLKCDSYECDDSGVHRYSELLGDVEVISHPLMPVKRVTNIETYEEKLEIAYKRGQDEWKTITVSRETLASSQKILALARQGVDVNSENAREVIRYMSKLESKNYDSLPRQNSVSHMGWMADGQFLPYTDQVTYDGESAELNKIYSEFKPTGSWEEWLKIAKEVRKGESVPARIILAAGFAGPLVKLLNALPFFVHLWGEKGCGKSVGLMLSASIWGNPEIGAYPKTFNGTKVFLEEQASFCCNLPIYLDELQVINDNRKNFDEIIYTLCEGSNRGRGARDGGLRVQKRWATDIITTGETPIVQSNSGGGAVVRTIEVNYKSTPLFGTDLRAREVAELLKENYGHAGKRFIEALQKDSVLAQLKEAQTDYYRQLVGEIDAKQVISASVLLAADLLATAFIFKDRRALTVDDVKEFLVTKRESDVNRRCYEFILDWVEANPVRFSDSDVNTGEHWGTIEGKTVYVNRTVFENALRTGGYSSKQFLNWARLNHLLESEDQRMTVKKVLPEGRKRCIGIRMTGLEEATDQAMGLTRVEDDDMPF